MFTKRRLIVAGFSLLGLVGALAAADRANPPDMARFAAVSPEVVDRHGALLRPFLSRDGYWRLRTAPADVNPRYLALLKAYEDKRFDDHWGVDPLAMLRAAFQLARAQRIVSGGSTLSMQAARLLEPRPRGIAAKLFQMARALQLEERYSKDEILSIYLTLAPFGGNLEGVRAASLAYFGKQPSALDLSEAALLVALPQSPARDRPDRYGLAAIKGRNKVLARMVDEGVVSAGDAAVARREGVASLRLQMPLSAPHLAQRLERAHPHTLRLATTIDAPLQGAIERMAARERAYLEDGGSLAIVVVENRTRNVLAYVGGTDYWGRSGQIDLAMRARSPGSTRSATYACVTLRLPPEKPSMTRAAKTHGRDGANASIAQPAEAPNWLTMRTRLRPIRSLRLPQTGPPTNWQKANVEKRSPTTTYDAPK